MDGARRNAGEERDYRLGVRGDEKEDTKKGTDTINHAARPRLMVSVPFLVGYTPYHGSNDFVPSPSDEWLYC